jgi:hypothetical protein
VKYVWFEGAWVPLDAFPPRVAMSGPAIHPDFAEPLMCHADGKMHGSRSTYDAAVRAAGCEVIGRSEARRQQERGAWRGGSSSDWLNRTGALEPVAATLRRINGGN